MNIAATATVPHATISRPDVGLPILVVTGPTEISLRAGTLIVIDDQLHAFESETPLDFGNLIVGEDYGIKLDAGGRPIASLLGPENPVDAGWIAGFHYAPGGNAEAREGGTSMPAINPHSLWDLGFRPSCPDPRGMALVDGKVWVDIYLLCVDHKRHGTSRCGATIADGRSLDRLNYHDAVAIYAEHGKRLMTYDEFRAAAHGVTEKSAAERHPKTSGLDADRTSRFGLMQATGNLWVWGTDGDPDAPRPSLFGGSWFVGSNAGSRFADLDYWAEDSNVVISARGASDHLSPA